MFQEGAPVTASDADEEIQNEFTGAGTLSKGFISRANEGWCTFETEFELRLGPENYELTVGQNPSFTVTFSQQDLANAGAVGEFDNPGVYGVNLTLK